MPSPELDAGRDAGSDPPARSFRRALLFWWILFFVVQAAERLFLVATTVRQEPASLATLALTLSTGLRADLIAATFGALAAAALGLLLGAPLAVLKRGRARASAWSPWQRGLTAAAVLVALLMLAVTTADMGYYHYSQQRLDLVFFEYLSDLFAQASEAQVATSQVGRQTAAELQEGRKWAAHVAGFLVVMAAAIAVWCLAFARVIGPAFSRWEAAAPGASGAVLGVALAVGATGLHPDGHEAIQRVSISDSTYYTLSQNPFWYANASLRGAFEGRHLSIETELLRTMPEDTALRITRETVAPGATFLSERYPLVHVTVGAPGVRLDRPANVLLLFIEGLDRRFLERTVRGIRVTPFLDRLKAESVYFEHFFANGALTFHGLFASFCSHLPRYGMAAIRTHYANDFLCLPTLLRRGGYRTEMVIGQNRDRAHSHVGLFMARNGLDALLDDGHFPPEAPRLRLGIVDGALFDLVRSRIEALKGSDRPFFVTTLTTSTHHPFEIPLVHPEVQALRAEKDRYLAALRYADLEFERFFSGLRRDGLLRNTAVFILGDHGRHEKIGRADLEKQLGVFTAPLFVWLDESLRSPATYRPRRVSGIASQVDLVPTILSMNGLMPSVSPFFGRDLSCALARDCPEGNQAYLSNATDDLIGLADREGIWVYRFRTRTGEQVDLTLTGRPRTRAVTDPDVASRHQRLLALYVTANLLLERNRIWSSREFGGAK